METTVKNWIVMSISVVLMSTLVSTIMWTFTIGLSIMSSFQDQTIKLYSEAGMSIMIETSNLDSVDATNVYKMLEVNRNIIKNYYIRNLDGTYVYDTRDLLKRPIDRFSVIITGDAAVGFQVRVQQVSTPVIGGTP